jgi:hypothetical protein
MDNLYRRRFRVRGDLVRDVRDPNEDPAQQFESEAEGPWLLIPFDDADGGVRPLTSADYFWESRNIWFEGGDIKENAIAGKPTPVFARIWNLGTITCFPTRVDFGFVDASLGIPWNAPFVFGTAYDEVRPQIMGPGVRIVKCPKDWIPPPPTGNTHPCLVVMCSCEVANDMPSQPWNVMQDRHVAQRNVTVVAGKPGETLLFHVRMTNVLAVSATVQVAAQAAWVVARTASEALNFSAAGMESAVNSLNRPMAASQQRLLARRAALLLARRSQVTGASLQSHELREAVQLGQVQTIGRGKDGAIVIPDATAVKGLNGFSTIGAITRLQPLEIRMASVAINVPEPVRNTRYFVVRIAQLENEFVTGGYTFVIDLHESG